MPVLQESKRVNTKHVNMKLAKPSTVEPLTDLLNTSLLTSKIPDSLKIAQVAPIHKKNSTLDKGNYCPVSILPVISKILKDP